MVAAAAADGRLDVLLGSKIKRITADAVDLELKGEVITLRNDAIIVCAGGILPTEFLKNIGVVIETKYGTT
jgi:thioredoxin reductase